MKIISFKICPFVQRVTALLEAKGLDYEIEYIQLSDKPDWFLALSPHGQVPLLVTDGGQALFESEAIIEYIDEISKPLVSALTPELRATNRAWSYLASKHYLTQCGVMRSATKEIFDQKNRAFEKALEKLEAVLPSAGFFNGDNLGNVETAWLPLLHRAKIVETHTGYDFLAAFPKVKAWQARILSLPLVDRTVAADFEQRFSDFYLSSKTWLGGAKSACTTADSACSSSTCC